MGRFVRSSRNERLLPWQPAAVTFVLTDFELRLRHRQSDWTALSVDVTVRPVEPSHGKAVTGAEFDNREWLASVLAWETGELDLDAVRRADGRLVAKHYDLSSSAQLAQVFAELVALLRDGSVPADAVTSRLDPR